MKKLYPILSLLLILCTLFSLCACTTPTETTGAKPSLPVTGEETVTPSETESAQPTPTPTPAPTPTPTPTETPVHVHEIKNGECSCGQKTAEILAGKSAVFYGDSIVIATGEKEHPTWGYAGRVHRDYGLKSFLNSGVNGASISDVRGTNLVINQIPPRGPKFHFVVLEGGTNDAWDVAPVGKMSDIDPKDVTADTFKDSLNTFSGGLENLFYYATKRYEGATFLYVITPKMSMNAGKLTDMREYVDATVAICEKWGIPYINFYDMDASFYGDDMSSYFTTYIPDGVHPNSEGYEKIAPYVADAMAEAYLNQKD